MVFSGLHAKIGVLLSGGLDSSILAGVLAAQNRDVQPFYVQCGLVWERDELRAVLRYLKALASPQVRRLVVLNQPLCDVYHDHWSVTGRHIPDRSSPDEAVYLPGRNPLLILKAALWCQRHGIGQLALGVLKSNPFGDATPAFFCAFQSALNQGAAATVELVRPLAEMDKRQVMELGRKLPLEATLSCIAPIHGKHCGQCNKCAERQAAFALAEIPDPTEYASPLRV